jgi:hypothetical protein
MDLTDFFNSINKTKKNIVSGDEKAEKFYIPFVVNKSLSYHKDAIFHSNFMNERSYLDKRMQYEYFLHALPKANRYGKWHKDEDGRIEPIMEFYGYSKTRAKEVLKILSDSQIEAIKEALNKGGKS